MDNEMKKFLDNGSLTGRLMHAYHLMLSANIPLEDAAICRDAVDFVAEEQRKCLAAFDEVRYLRNKLASESAQVARLEHALKTARREALEEAAKIVDDAGGCIDGADISDKIRALIERGIEVLADDE